MECEVRKYFWLEDCAFRFVSVLNLYLPKTQIKHVSGPPFISFPFFRYLKLMNCVLHLTTDKQVETVFKVISGDGQ
jgi:hypothetical protein